MSASIWSASLTQFNADLAAPSFSPAAGTAAAISARLGASLLIKVLQIAANQKSFTGDRARVADLVSALHQQSSALAKAADEDGAAFGEYLTCVREKADAPTRDTAMRKAIDVPMTAARCALEVLGTGQQAVNLVPAFVLADLRAAAYLLSGSVSALLATVDDNLRHLSVDPLEIQHERVAIEQAAIRLTETIGANIAKIVGMSNTPVPIKPPFTLETARLKVRAAEDAWNSRDPERVALAYTPDSEWRNRSEFISGREEIKAFLKRKWAKELDYRLKKTLWAFTRDRIAVSFEYEWHDETGQWYRSYGNELWEFDEAGLMRRRLASINDAPIAEQDRRIR